MMLLSGMLCRLWKCTAGCSEPSEPPAKKTEPKQSDESTSDDLTVIRGIGIATQNRLYADDITTYARLARTSPEDVRKTVGTLARGANIEDWIARAAELSKSADT